MYNFIRRILFLFPTEGVHYFSMNMLKLACSIPIMRKFIAAQCGIKNEAFQRELFGLKFRNSIGLAAGFDKNARYLRELETLGFGYLEIGTVTPRPQAGNEKPRLFRLPKDRALINRMGFNNDGVKIVADKLRKWRSNRQNIQLIIGGNIGKNKNTPNEEAWKDYETCFRALYDYVDYFVVNVSSPNTPGLRALQEKEALRKILTHLQAISQALGNTELEDPKQRKPLLLKIAPDLNQQQLDDVIDLAMEINLDGIVATNTSIAREGLGTEVALVEKIGAGGLSGKPITHRSTEVIKYIAQKTKGQLPIIASGGIFTGDDAKEKLIAGASLVQVWTGFIYEGPAIVRKILRQQPQTTNYKL